MGHQDIYPSVVAPPPNVVSHDHRPRFPSLINCWNQPLPPPHNVVGDGDGARAQTRSLEMVRRHQHDGPSPCTLSLQLQSSPYALIYEKRSWKVCHF